MDKDQRSLHIHLCRHLELANHHNRSKTELKYCYTCIKWFFDEDWEKHCQDHISILRTNRCGLLLYCGLLLRPAFCPYCLGDARLDASKRSRSFTAETKLRPHLKHHIQASCWPLQCPHPLCDSTLEDRTSFLYHLSDIHGLKRTVTQLRFDSEPHIQLWKPASSGADIDSSRKRKRERNPDTQSDLQSRGDDQPQAPNTTLQEASSSTFTNELEGNQLPPSITSCANREDSVLELIEDALQEVYASRDDTETGNASVATVQQRPVTQPDIDYRGMISDAVPQVVRPEDIHFSPDSDFQVACHIDKSTPGGSRRVPEGA